MIRASRSEETEGMLTVAGASGLFEPDQLVTLRQTIERFFQGTPERDELWLTDLEDAEVVGVAYCAAEPMTDRTWNLLFLAVHPEVQGQGRGSHLLQEVEATLRHQDARLLIIETASGDDFEATRRFYRSQGYDQEGQIRDFYAQESHKITFRKPLA